MLSKVLIGGGIAAALLLGVLLTTTTPVSAGPFGILVTFILMYVIALVAITFILRVVSAGYARIRSLTISKKPVAPLSLKRAYYFASVIALAPVILIGMQSVGEVGIYDLILVLLFVVIACAYVAKRSE